MRKRQNLGKFNLTFFFVDQSEVYAEDSQCIPTESGDGRCYQTACVKDEMVLKINVRGEWLSCEFDFQKLDVRVGAGALPQTLVCPRLSTACPDLFCPFTCAGRGSCNYANMVNETIQPKCECFDSEDTSPGCSDSLLPDGAFLDNADGLFNNLEEDFFDPLIAVFVDHPDKWATSSWAWAAGLLTVFLIMLLCICSAFWPSTPKKDVDSHREASGSFPTPSTRPSSGQSSRAPYSSESAPDNRRYHRGSTGGSSGSGRPGRSAYDLGDVQQSNGELYSSRRMPVIESTNYDIDGDQQSDGRSYFSGGSPVVDLSEHDMDDVQQREGRSSSRRIPVIEPTHY
jgi:hypothetical protein